MIDLVEMDVNRQVAHLANLCLSPLPAFKTQCRIIFYSAVHWNSTSGVSLTF